MGLFGPPKIKVTPRDFVKGQIDEIFSDHFIQSETSEFGRISKQNSILQGARLETYLRERQNVISHLFQIAWCRMIPQALFIEHSSLATDDPRVDAVNSGVYHMTLSRAQEAGMDTFGYMSSVFIAQIAPPGYDTQHADYRNLYIIYGTDFTSRYIAFEALVKRHKFVTQE